MTRSCLGHKNGLMALWSSFQIYFCTTLLMKHSCCYWNADRCLFQNPSIISQQFLRDKILTNWLSRSHLVSNQTTPKPESQILEVVTSLPTRKGAGCASWCKLNKTHVPSFGYILSVFLKQRLLPWMSLNHLSPLCSFSMLRVSLWVL